MIAKCYKNGLQVKSFANIIAVKYIKKYDYFEFHQKIYRYEIIFVHRPVEVDKVELYEEGEKKPCLTVERKDDEQYA